MRTITILVTLITVTLSSQASETETVDRLLKLHPTLLDDARGIDLSTRDGWVFREGNDPSWSKIELNDDDWETLKPSDLQDDRVYQNRTFEGWFRLRFKLDEAFESISLGWWVGTYGAMSMYLDGELVAHYGHPDPEPGKFKAFHPLNQVVLPQCLETGREYLLSIHLVNRSSHRFVKHRNNPPPVAPLIGLMGPEFRPFIQNYLIKYATYFMVWITALSLLSILFWILYLKNRGEKALFHISMVNTSLLIMILAINMMGNANRLMYDTLYILFTIGAASALGFIPMVVSRIILQKLPRLLVYLYFLIMATGIIYYFFPPIYSLIPLALSFGSSIAIIIVGWKKIRPSQWIVIAGLIITVLWMFIYTIYFLTDPAGYPFLIISGICLSLPVALLIYVAVRFTEILHDTRKKADEIVSLSESKLAAEMENKKILEGQKQLLEVEVNKRTAELKESLEDLKKTQKQLIHTEKMASLGELTAGIAHEIQNPLNFVNNFADVSIEMIDEIHQEDSTVETRHALSPDDPSPDNDAKTRHALSLPQHVSQTLTDIKQNLEKIHHHGKRAETIVKGMLMHSRAGSGDKEPTDINALADEYLRLAYHGLRARDKSFNATFVTDFDNTIPRIEIVAQDIGRVLLNLINNAFHAVDQRNKDLSGFKNLTGPDDATSPGTTNDDPTIEKLHATSLQTTPTPKTQPHYTPTVTVTTKNHGNRIEIAVMDNGAGIPDGIRDKIFQPFFTTKKGGEGTGLGLSISYDIVRAQGGEIRVESSPGQTLFTITLPIQQI